MWRHDEARHWQFDVIFADYSCLQLSVQNWYSPINIVLEYGPLPRWSELLVWSVILFTDNLTKLGGTAQHLGKSYFCIDHILFLYQHYQKHYDEMRDTSIDWIKYILNDWNPHRFSGMQHIHASRAICHRRRSLSRHAILSRLATVVLRCICRGLCTGNKTRTSRRYPADGCFARLPRMVLLERHTWTLRVVVHVSKDVAKYSACPLINHKINICCAKVYYTNKLSEVMVR